MSGTGSGLITNYFRPVVNKNTNKKSSKKDKSPKDSQSLKKENFGGMLWTDKYRPTSSLELVGNTASINRIRYWLQEWDKERAAERAAKNGETAKSKSKPRALLVSGAPGVGKTTAVLIIAQELKLDPIQLNASDNRNKSSVEEFLPEVTGCKGITSFFNATTRAETTKNAVLIMDEVDGMSTSDRGGNIELCKAIPISKIPIICLCNNREKDSVKTLSKHCEDIRFNSPTPGQMLPWVRRIASNEGYHLSDAQLLKVLESCCGDFRQALNLLQMWHFSSQSLNNSQITGVLSNTSKDIDLGAYDILPKLFTNNKSITIKDKFELYFMDYQMLPLLVQENYPEMSSTNITEISRAADSISEGDIIGSYIHRNQDYTLMPVEALLSCIRPPMLVGSTGLKSMVRFPMWLGKNSKQNKFKRLIHDVYCHSAHRTLTDVTVIRLDYVSILSHILTKPLVEDKKEGIASVIKFMDLYGFSKEDRDTIIELCEALGPSHSENITTAVKSNLTKTFNKDHYEFRKLSESEKKNVGKTKSKSRGKNSKRSSKKKSPVTVKKSTSKKRIKK